MRAPARPAAIIVVNSLCKQGGGCRAPAAPRWEEAVALALRWRALRVAGAAAVTLLALLVWTRVQEWQAYARPLERELGRHPQVVAYEVRSYRQPPVVVVTLADVRNLREAYLSVEEAVAHALGGPFRLEVRGQPDPRLVEDYYALHYHVVDAAARGGFAAAAEAIAREARARGIERARLLVDERHVYLQLHRGRHYLYVVMPRQPQVPPEVAP